MNNTKRLGLLSILCAVLFQVARLLTAGIESARHINDVRADDNEGFDKFPHNATNDGGFSNSSAGEDRTNDVRVHQEDALETFSASESYTILPEKVYTVIGKESSGTHFVTRIVRDALGLFGFREGNFFQQGKDRDGPVRVQHLSLPQNAWCDGRNELNILDVIYPPQCTESGVRWSNEKERKECLNMKSRGQDILQRFPNEPKIAYPYRYFLNITSHKHWYETHGTEQYIIIVVRDKDFSLKSKIKNHCSDADFARKEDRMATRIINDAIRTFLLEEREETTDLAATTGTQDDGEEDLLWDQMKFLDGEGDDGFLYSSLIPARNNVVLVSYEAMMKMEGDYVRQLYKALGIKSDHIPVFKDGNAKYNKTKTGEVIEINTMPEHGNWWPRRWDEKLFQDGSAKYSKLGERTHITKMSKHENRWPRGDGKVFQDGNAKYNKSGEVTEIKKNVQT